MRVAGAVAMLAAPMLALALALHLVATPLAPAAAEVTGVPTPQGLEAKLVRDAKDGKLDELSLLEAALVASGVPDGQVAGEAKRVRELLAPAIARARTQRSARARGDVLLRALHETVLRKYAASASEIDDVARTGEYNCLSSALLYVVAADGLLDEPKAMVTRYHAYARVTVDGVPVDVETTTPNGFAADRKKLMTPAFVKQIAGDRTNPKELLDDLQRPEELPVLSLVAGVYSNRAVALVQRGQLGTAVVALDRAARLASGGFRARAAAWRGGVLNNGALALADDGRLDDARALLELALDGSEGDTKKLLTTNLGITHLQLAERALADEDWATVLAEVQRAERRGVKSGAPLRARANAALAALEGNAKRCDGGAPRESATCLAGLARSHLDDDVDAAVQHARRAYSLSPAEPNVWRTLFYALAAKAKAESDRGRCDRVEALVKEALPHKAALDGQRWSPAEVMAGCWAQRADAAFDKKDWTTAGALYARASSRLPNDDALRANVGRVDVNRAIELAKAGRCDDARPLAHRASRADASLADTATRLLESCAAVRAKSAADDKDWATASAELRRGLRDAPKSASLRENLGAMLHNRAAELVKAGSCDDARALLPELVQLGREEAKRAVERRCP